MPLTSDQLLTIWPLTLGTILLTRWLLATIVRRRQRRHHPTRRRR